MNATILIGRILLVALFLFSGAMKFLDPAGTAAHIAEKGLPAPEVLAYAAGTLEVVAGLLVAIGWKARYAAFALAAFALAAGLMFHDFWNYQGQEQINQMLHLFKNVAMIGGLLVVAGHGPGTIAFEPIPDDDEHEEHFGTPAPARAHRR